MRDGWLSWPRHTATQPYILLYYKTTMHMAHGCEKLAQGFYTAATWLGIEPHICDMLVRRPTISHRATILFAVGYIML